MFKTKPMGRLFYILGFLACVNNLQAQVHFLTVPDLKRRVEIVNSINVDTLKLWNYQFDDSKKSKSTDTIQLLGRLKFFRVRPIADSTYFKIYHQYWKPYMAFSVFKLSDSAYVKKASTRTMMFSSCVAPEVGGDYFIIGQYIFANFDVCLNCALTGTDYCRPLINFVIGKVSDKRAGTLDEIFSQFVIDPQRKLKL